ncbi:MAG: thrombospondin type 3 repeat-containing protein [Dehalococcoidia bacterium]
MRQQIVRFGIPAILLVAIASLAAAFLTFSSANAVFTPVVDIRFCNGLPTDFPSSGTADPDLVGNPSCVDPATIPASAASDLTTTFTIPVGNLTPGFSMTVQAGTVSTDASVPNGEKVAGLTALTTIGIFNMPCVTPFTVEAVLYDSATTGATVSPNPEGTPDRFAPIVTDANGDNRADPTSPFIQNNVSFYETHLDPDLDYPGGPNGPNPPITPLARYSGATRVLSDWFLFALVVLPDSELIDFNADSDNRTNPLARAARNSAGQNFGLTILGDPTASLATPSTSPLTDLCAPISITAMLKGTTPGGFTRSLTPSTGSWGYGQWAMSNRDADADGLDNLRDSCPFVTNLNTDADSDAIDGACDPTPINTGSGDHDGDLFPNHQDNCILVANGGAAQVSSENSQTYVVAAPDGGPGNDGIGDACDANPANSQPQGAFVESLLMIPKCIGDSDADDDGYCTPQDLDDTNPAVSGYVSNTGTDQECCNANGDRFGWFAEIHIGTDPLRTCGFTPGGDPASETWPADLVESNSINISDVLTLKPLFGQAVPPAPRRSDLVPSRSINISDVLAIKPQFGTSCTP